MTTTVRQVAASRQRREVTAMTAKQMRQTAENCRNMARDYEAAGDFGSAAAAWQAVDYFEKEAARCSA